MVNLKTSAAELSLSCILLNSAPSLFRLWQVIESLRTADVLSHDLPSNGSAAAQHVGLSDCVCMAEQAEIYTITTSHRTFPL